MNRLFNDTGFIILVLTAASYGLAYVYQVSYMGFYHLSPTFVDMNITSMVRPLLFTFCVLSLFCYLIYVIYLIIVWRTSIKFSDLKKVNVVLLIGTIIGGSLVSMIMFGEFKASYSKEYTVIQQENHFFVAITSYKDSLIIAPLDLEKESITPKFKTIEMKELKDAETIHFENGLKVEDVRNSKDLNEQIFFGRH